VKNYLKFKNNVIKANVIIRQLVKTSSNLNKVDCVSGVECDGLMSINARSDSKVRRPPQHKWSLKVGFKLHLWRSQTEAGNQMCQMSRDGAKTPNSSPFHLPHHHLRSWTVLEWHIHSQDNMLNSWFYLLTYCSQMSVTTVSNINYQSIKSTLLEAMQVIRPTFHIYKQD